jgi:hypothetical protein
MEHGGAIVPAREHVVTAVISELTSDARHGGIRK